MHWGMFRALEDILSALEVFSALEDIAVNWGDISIVMEHPQCTDNILNTNHDTPNALMIFPNAMSTSMHCIRIKAHSLNNGKVAATPILKSVPSQFSPFIL